MLTIFTPTYNRSHTLSRLYKSLIEQTDPNFEWIIVDDGSSDDTGELVKSWIAQDKIKIIYTSQSNGGKHRAINKGVQLAKGELFFIVDSDDWLAGDAVKVVKKTYDDIKSNKEFAGIVGLKVYEDGKKVGSESNYEILDCNAIEFRFKYKIKGDMAEVVKTSVLKEFPFPEIPNEKFCPEALIWNRIATKYKFRFFYGRIYYCQYLPDGLSSKIYLHRKNSPIASTIYYTELARMDISFVEKIKATMNYWRFAQFLNRPFREKIMKIPFLLTIIALPGIFLMKISDRIK